MQKDKVIYEGNVSFQGEGTLTADRVILYLDENRGGEACGGGGDMWESHAGGEKEGFIADKMV